MTTRRLVLAALLGAAVLAAPAASAPPTAGPVVWFSPLPPNPACGCNYGGSNDYMRLFAANAPWRAAAQHVHVFKLYGGWVEYRATADELRRIGRRLAARRVSVAIEAQPLVATARCGDNVEGYDDPGGAARLAAALWAAGIRVSYLAFDEPFYDGSLVAGPTACHWTATTVAREIKRYVARFKVVFPHVAVGDIEPLVSGVAPLEGWLDTYKQVTGSALAFLQLDVQFENEDWPQQALQVERFAHSRRVPFGFIDIGDGDTDAAWSKTAELRDATFEVQYGGRPDQIVFQSWLDRPDNVLPETKPGTFTWLIDRYFRPRPSLELTVSPAAAGGSRSVTGRIDDSSGRPLQGARIALTATPLAGVGADSVVAISGTVPTGATQAQIGIRVNTECSCAGPSDFLVSGVSYREGASGPDLVPDGSFSEGLADWAAYGDAAQLEPTGAAGGWRLHVQAAAGQVESINSAPFPVTAGARFAADFSVRIAPISHGSGYLTIIFEQQGTEFERRTAPLDPAVVPLASPTTGVTGRFAVRNVRLAAGSQLVEAWFRGDARRFPAYASQTTG